ncbi:efflux RND transporter permease subunit [Microbacterium sp. NPDC080220]|uniref:efflux RND transporter permease subunit n=1 Tax=Microbacterium sp. NPDC080220 TaxID=3161017 RepID=UPI00341D5409
MFRLARFSLANRTLVALVTLLIAAFGVFSMTQLKQELIPSIELPRTTVVTVVPGASPEVIDEQVSVPVSQAVADLDDVEQVIATSSSSMSIVSIAYAYGTDVDDFRASVEQAIDSIAAALPSGAEPNLVAGSTADIPVIFMTASAADQDLPTLSATLSDTVVPRLEAIEGVRSAAVSGGAVERVVISPDQAALAANGLSVQAISQTLQANGMTLPLGSVRDDGSLVPVQGGTAVVSTEAIAALPMASQTQPGVVVTVGDVATVDLVTEEQTSITRMNGEEALSISITANQGGDVVAISHTVTDAVTELSDEIPGLELTIVFDQAPFIEESIQHLAIEGLLGLLFAIIVILVFLLSVRATVVTAISIPLSVLVTFIGLNLGGYSLNMLTLGALTIAIGRVVDDSIVVIENIKRHLSYGEEKVHAILAGVREVAGAITSSTLTTVAVFLPIALVGGLVGELFAPFALTVTIAMLSSLLVALTIVPVLSYWFLRQPKDVADPEAVRAAAEEKEHKSWLQRGYKPILRGTQKHPIITLVASGLLLVITVSLVPLLKVDFLGSTGQNMIMVSQTFPAGSDLQTISEGTRDVEDTLLGIDGTEEVMLMAGSGGGAAGDFSALLGGGGGTATFIVNTDPNADQTALKDEVRAQLAEIDVPGDVSLSDAAAMAGGFGGSVDVVVSAENEADLAVAADEVYAALEDTPRTTEVASDLAPAQPIVQITVDRTVALENGFTEIQLLGLVGNILSPQSVGSVTIDDEEYNIFIDAAPAPQTVGDLAAMPIPTPTGLVPLTDLATVEEVTVPTSVTRQDGDLVATISVTPAEGELGVVTTEVEERIEDLDLPSGTTATIGGLAQTQQESFQQLGLAMLVAIAIVFLLLVATFRSLAQPLILLVSIPFAATGAIALLLITGRPLGISALIGMLMLIGIVVTNAIVLIDLVNQYRKQGQTVRDAVLNGARQRLRPILMTALATIFALTPMALGVTGSSGFISQDLAIVVIGGLISSTALTLILVPVLYLMFEQGRERSTTKRTADHQDADRQGDDQHPASRREARTS